MHALKSKVPCIACGIGLFMCMPPGKEPVVSLNLSVCSVCFAYDPSLTARVYKREIILLHYGTLHHPFTKVSVLRSVLWFHSLHYNHCGSAQL